MLPAQHAICNCICSKAGACRPDGSVHVFAGVPSMRRREVVVHQPTGALTGQVICTTTHALCPVHVLSPLMIISALTSHLMCPFMH